MARARNIKPSIMDNEDLAALPALTRLLFIYMWMLADREGRIEDRPGRIKKQALGYDDGNADEMLNGLAEKGFIDRYESNGIKVIQILAFTKHQTPHIREAASELPGKGSSTALVVPSTNLGSVEASPRSPDTPFPLPDSPYPLPDVISTKPLSGSGGRFDQFWLAYPKKVGKDAARKAFDKRKVDEELLESMLAAIATQAKSANWKKDSGQFIPNPSTWLNEGRWMDETGPVKQRDWWTVAGFDTEWDARNADCSPSTASQFHDGKRLEAA